MIPGECNNQYLRAVLTLTARSYVISPFQTYVQTSDVPQIETTSHVSVEFGFAKQNIGCQCCTEVPIYSGSERMCTRVSVTVVTMLKLGSCICLAKSKQLVLVVRTQKISGVKLVQKFGSIPEEQYQLQESDSVDLFQKSKDPYKFGPKQYVNKKSSKEMLILFILTGSLQLMEPQNSENLFVCMFSDLVTQVDKSMNLFSL